MLVDERGGECIPAMSQKDSKSVWPGKEQVYLPLAAAGRKRNADSSPYLTRDTDGVPFAED